MSEIDFRTLACSGTIAPTTSCSGVSIWGFQDRVYTPKRKCEYCGTLHDEDRCKSCGAPSARQS